MNKIIRVTGTGKISVPPDTICIVLNVEETRDTYKEAMILSTKINCDIKNVFTSCGLNEKDLKTTRFQIAPSFENEKKKGEWKRVFKGFSYYQTLKIEFDLDHELLGMILNGLLKCELHPEFRIEYTVKDKESVKNDLLKNAVKDSKIKAEILANAADMKLGEIRSMNYSWDEIQLSNSFDKMLDFMRLSDDCDNEDMSLNIQPEDITASDTVTIVWTLQ